MYRIVPATVMLLILAGATSLASAETLLTEAQALKIIFPKAASETQVQTLSSVQRGALQKKTGLRFPESEYRCFVAHGKQGTDGYAMIMNEIGKHEYITFIVGVSPKGEVTDVAVMEYRETRGGEVKEQRFLRQFRGKKMSDPIQVDRDIVNYTGATLSSHAIAYGVRKALALVQVFYLQPAAGRTP
jgi:Na+-translocating ferredoxin:NAD+ oxidoreductase RnfG subunit